MVKKKVDIMALGKRIGLTPLNKRVAVKRFETKERTEGGIIIPEQAKEIPIAGKVLAVADDCSGILVGDTVFFGKYAGTEISIDGEQMLLVKSEDLLGIYNK